MIKRPGTLAAALLVDEVIAAILLNLVLALSLADISLAQGFHAIVNQLFQRATTAFWNCSFAHFSSLAYLKSSAC